MTVRGSIRQCHSQTCLPTPATAFSLALLCLDHSSLTPNTVNSFSPLLWSVMLSCRYPCLYVILVVNFTPIRVWNGHCVFSPVCFCHLCVLDSLFALCHSSSMSHDTTSKHGLQFNLHVLCTKQGSVLNMCTVCFPHPGGWQPTQLLPHSATATILSVSYLRVRPLPQAWAIHSIKTHLFPGEGPMHKGKTKCNHYDVSEHK